MTDLLSRPVLRVGATTPTRARGVAWSAVLAAAVSATLGLITVTVLVVVGWFAGETGSFTGALRVGGLAWLLGSGGGLDLPDVSIRAIPVGSLLAGGYLLYRGGVWTARRSAVDTLRDVLIGAVLMGSTYAVCGLAVSGLTRTADAHADPLRTLWVMAATGLLLGGLGLLRGCGRSTDLLDLLPPELRAAVTGGAAGFFTMIALGGAAVVVCLGVHFASTTARAESMSAGVVGAALMALVGLALVPNAVLCAGSFLAGPGFMLGTGTSLTPGEVVLGPLPALPLLGAIPRSGGEWWQSALLVAPVVAGVVAGLVAVRRYPVTGYQWSALRGGLAGLTGGLAFGLSTWLATGAVGPGRMQDVGPDVVATLLVCAVALALGGALAGAGAPWLADELARRRSAASAPETPTAPETPPTTEAVDAEPGDPESADAEPARD